MARPAGSAARGLIPPGQQERQRRGQRAQDDVPERAGDWPGAGHPVDHREPRRESDRPPGRQPSIENIAVALCEVTRQTVIDSGIGYLHVLEQHDEGKADKRGNRDDEPVAVVGMGIPEQAKADA